MIAQHQSDQITYSCGKSQTLGITYEFNYIVRVCSSSQETSQRVCFLFILLELDHVSTQRTQGGLNLNFQTHPYGVDFLNP